MIQNKTKNFVIIKKKRFAKSFFAQGIGLSFRLKKPDFGLIFLLRKERIIDITMCMVFFPLDLLFLDKNKKVVEIVKDLKPFSFYHPEHKAMYFIELPVGLIGKTKIGDKIDFK